MGAKLAAKTSGFTSNFAPSAGVWPGSTDGQLPVWPSREKLDATRHPFQSLAQSLHWLGDFYAAHLDEIRCHRRAGGADGVLLELAAGAGRADARQPCSARRIHWQPGPGPEVREFEHALLRGNRNEAQQVVQRVWIRSAWSASRPMWCSPPWCALAMAGRPTA